MAVDLRLNRVNADSAWGFRIVGGADFGEPLIVVKVNENSLAENAGMMVGDVIVRINDTPTAGLTHTEAHDLLIAQGNEFVLGVRRGSMPSHIFHEEIDEEFANISKHVEQSIEGNYEEQYSSMVKEAERTIDQDVLDEAIQRINEYNIQDTLEKRIQDQVERTQHTVSAEQIINSHQTRMEKMQPITHGIRTDKKWSTFLQKPDNPIPKSKKKIEEEEQEGEKYTVVIQKQPSRRKRKEMQEKRVQFSEDVTEMEIEKEEEIEEDDYSDTIEIQQSLDIEVNVDVQEEEIVEVEEGLVDYETEDEIDSQNFGKRDTSEEIEVTYPPLSEIKIEAAEGNTTTLEEQLLAVQKQLQALSMLPSAIQLTLDAVSKQLASIVSTKEEKEMNGDISKSSSERDEIELQEQLTEEELLEDRSSSEIAEAEPHKQNGNDDHSNLGDELDDDLEIGEEELREILERNATPVEEKEQDPFAGMTDEEKQEILREEQRIREEEERKMKEEELKAKKQKVERLNAAWPWSDTKKHVYSINFKKYEPPPKSLEHLQYSEVYKMLQEEEPARPRGIAARPEKIPAVQDYYQASQEAP
ncbi:unnamed protein product [Acanthoscelides obtectus]|uniref:PDZ domain-containing protein n=2 Tax=Acanthoscelides obtectus TaxID=200917 RepID=A0A9P0KJJ9_ACAOB|nr:unnamed protein product [Acanthoscelides obtectus]CAK1662860.1 PDZ and LIM domain protein Zasp [Acanthoscelides obtectus]